LGKEGGGSTITQQLALKHYLDRTQPENKAWRHSEKLKNTSLPSGWKEILPKKKYISLYLNAVPFGDNIYGIRNASRTFFQKEPYQLGGGRSCGAGGNIKGKLFI
jgi:penicillin-binding protein 1A